MTTDNQNEILDIVDKNDKVIGQARRKEVHKDKRLIHRSIGVAIFNRRGEIFLQQRSKTKDTDPLLWTISCSGHLKKGDDYFVAAIRELQEELGIKVEIKPVVKYLCSAPQETEMVMLFQGEAEGPFQLNKSEILQGKFFTQEELNQKIKKGKIKLSFLGKVALEKLGWLKD